ncbi:hypothetical protein ACJIZ3_007802 [Penstemon smallii]|uniref:PB1 domain-containing protein n=1 Tax=Penstemon smallii TaxID=265156 RepID=A0ABD3T8W2_9LAMI
MDNQNPRSSTFPTENIGNTVDYQNPRSSTSPTENIGNTMDNQNTSPNEDQIPGKNQEDVPSTSRPNDPTRVRSLADLHGGCLSGSSNSRRHPAAGIPTGNIGGGPSDEIQAETTGENSLESLIEGFAGKKTRMEVAKSLNMSVSSFDKLRKNLDIRVWPRVNKKTKLTDKLSSAAILSLPISSNAASNDAESNTAESNAAAIPSAALVSLLAGSSNPTNTLALTNLPSSSSFRRDGDEFRFLCINDKPDRMKMELRNLNVNAIKVRANYKTPNGNWRLAKFTIDKNTTYNQLSEILLSKLVPVPQKMRIVYEDCSGDFVVLGDDEDMIICLDDCGRLINLVIRENDLDGARL